MDAIKGLGVALVTPFNADLSVDGEGLRRVVDFCIDGGVDYLVALGTTGESATLNSDEKKNVIQTILEANNNRVPVVIGIGGNDTAAVSRELREADLNPFAAVLSVSPYYNKPSQEGIYQHYKELAKVSAKPIIIYNVPARTGSNVLPETVIRLAKEQPNIAGVKEASGTITQIRSLLKEAPKDFVVLSGDDSTGCDSILEGWHGIISVLGQGMPATFKALVESALKNDASTAKELETDLMEGMELIFKEGNPTGIKAMLNCLDLCQPIVRLPLTEATSGLKTAIMSYLEKVNKITA